MSEQVTGDAGPNEGHAGVLADMRGLCGPARRPLPGLTRFHDGAGGV
jgi:hypothetical protein